MSRGVKDMGLANKIGNKVEPAHMKHYGQEQRSIIRQSSLKSAVLLIEAIIPRLQEDFSVKDLTQLTLETAEKFEEWVLR
jgi:uncharacterized lipoprotein YddW (UPF0748 family)